MFHQRKYSMDEIKRVRELRKQLNEKTSIAGSDAEFILGLLKEEFESTCKLPDNTEVLTRKGQIYDFTPFDTLLSLLELVGRFRPKRSKIGLGVDWGELDARVQKITTELLLRILREDDSRRDRNGLVTGVASDVIAYWLRSPDFIEPLKLRANDPRPSASVGAKNALYRLGVIK
jgi:hypothetical protein